MNHENQNQNQQLEGPWERVSTIDETSLQSAKGLPMSPEDRYSNMYGPREENWTFDTTGHAEENRQRHLEDRQAADIARESLRLGGRGEVRTSRPPMGDVLVSPDGKAYKADQESS